MTNKNHISLIIVLLFSAFTYAQNTATISGKVTDKNKKPVEGANISIVGYSGGTTTDADGKYKLKVPANKDITLAISFVSFKTVLKDFNLKPNQTVQFDSDLTLKVINMTQFNLVEEANRNTTMTKIKPNVITQLPSPSENVEAIIKTLPGVSSNNELSSQYSVRGGNFDENLIYVNDVEIYRPFLIRSGQQEGLSFVNSNMVSSILFSAGGFEAKYGDKMSSVLDIQYKEPLEFAGSGTFSFQGASMHIEGTNKNHRLSHITGVRYKSNQYVLQSLDTDGDYRPTFMDAQTYLTYDMSEKWEIGFLGNVALNKYNFIPESRETDFGTINEALKLSVFFEGQEIDQFQTYFGAFTNTFKPNDELELKFITSAYRSLEDEKFDIEGAYSIDELERDLSKDEFGDVKFNRGVGLFINHARNQLDALVFNVEHKGKLIKKKHITHWGIKFQHEDIIDDIREWNLVDSAGFSLPHVVDSVGYTDPNSQPYQELELSETLKASNHLSSNRFSTYAQRTWKWERDSVKFSYNIGVRASYWNFNNEFIVSPRTTFSFQPNWKHDYLFRFSTGFYYQPPFYKELRDLNGILNPNIKSQQSIHFVAALDHNLKAWGRPFKWTSEVYYKHMSNIIPYEVDNVRIRYYATNSANAYTVGIDNKINGEFVKGVESWFSFSLMQSKENLTDDAYYNYFDADGNEVVKGYTNAVITDSVKVEPGYIPRPTDQRVNFSLFFQDHLPNRPNIKMNISLHYGTGLPFGPPNKDQRYRSSLRMAAYRRVDLGFMVLLKGEEKELKDNNPFRKFKNIWISAEVFNLLQINNTISYLWIADVSGRQYAVPNYLTNRQVNVKLHFNF